MPALATFMTAAHIGLAAAAAAPNMSAAEAQFRATKPCPATGLARGPCKGYVVDRIVPPICGGTETPANMQWQTLAAAREKNKWERIGCRPGRKLVLPGEPSFIEAYPMDAPAPVIEAEPLTDAR